MSLRTVRKSECAGASSRGPIPQQPGSSVSGKEERAPECEAPACKSCPSLRAADLTAPAS